MQWGIFYFSVFELPTSFQYLPYHKALQALRQHIKQAQERISVDAVSESRIFAFEYFQRLFRHLFGSNAFCLHTVNYISKPDGIITVKLCFTTEFFKLIGGNTEHSRFHGTRAYYRD